jgi:hypothetical protein
MFDGWSGYDLAVATGPGLERVSVKTRSESDRWKASSWFMFADRMECDSLVFIFKPKTEPVRSWVIPFETAKRHGNMRTARRRDPHKSRRILGEAQTRASTTCETNWELNRDPTGDGVRA